MKRKKLWIAATVAALLLPGSANLTAQRTGLPREEFAARRAALMKACPEGIIILFGGALSAPGARFRQDNDFHYFTGCGDLNAVAALVPRTGRSYLFLPRQSEREKMIGGLNTLERGDGAERFGFSEVLPSDYLEEFLARNVRSERRVFYLRLSPADALADDRWESLIFLARKNRSPFDDQETLDQYRIRKLRTNYPWVEFRDVGPAVDRMRLIKTAGEVEILRRNGRISADGVKQAMLATRPGGYEYEIEAAAIGSILAAGAQGPAYAPIVGSGPNSCVWHYDENGRQVQDGDLVLMDFGADLDHLCMDITRTWPVSGKFTPEQREVYRVVLEVQKACIEAYRPGATAEDVRRHVAEVMKKKGLDPMGLEGGFGHHVGLSTHDGYGGAGPLEAGMVFAIEPGLYFPEKNIGIRIEDTVLITATGCEVLSKDVPKEIAEIEKFLATRKAR
ncbi:MAG: aminopeptidase P family protein [Candidatus Aminicenantes bacterium]|nr:aminopeptidase P family protein [Candidatus Aminicenantes bacterium]